LLVSSSDQNGSQLVFAYDRVLASPSLENRSGFVKVAHPLFTHQFVTAIDLIYQKDLTFQSAFFFACQKIPAFHMIGKICYSKTFDTILYAIRLKLQVVFHSQEEKDKHFEAIGKLFEMAQKLAGIEPDSKLIHLNLLYQNMSFNFTKGSIDYKSLVHTFQTVRGIVSDPDYSRSQELINLCIQLSAFLASISKNFCMKIFDDSVGVFLVDNSEIQSIRPLLVFLIMRMCRFPFAISKEFEDDHMKCVSKVITWLSNDLTTLMGLYLESESGKEEFNFMVPTFCQWGRFWTFEKLVQLPVIQISDIIKNGNWEARDLWLLKAIIELKRHVRFRV
jgi:hypothetical protein